MIGWAIEALIASTLLMLVVLTLRGPIAQRFGAHAAYLLWLLPALRMVLPRLPETAQPVRAIPIHIDVARLVAAARVEAAAPIATPIAAISPSIDWLMIGLAFWLVGAAVYLAWQLGRHYRFMSIALGKAGPGLWRAGIKVRLSPVVAGPLAAGIFHRHILLPADFERRYNEAEQNLALAHELAHHRRGDLIANAAALVMLALHWFNPVAHWAYRAFRADQELACDATVLRQAPPGSRSDYGRALIKSARAGTPAAACALGPATQLKRRITMIAQSTRSRARRIAGFALATTLTGLGLGLTASGSIASPSIIAPVSVKPLFNMQPRPQAMAQPQPVLIANREDRAPQTGAQGDDAPPPPAPPAAPLPPLPPMAAESPIPPVPPVPPAAPVPAMRHGALSAQQAEAMQHAAEAARKAGEEARRAVANIDFAKLTREAMAEARAELERECTHAKPAPANETDQAAIARLSAGCVDMAEINREVQAALREASDEIRNDKDMSDAERARALAAIDKTRAEMARKSAQ